MKKIEPTMLMIAIRQAMSRRRMHTGSGTPTRSASSLATRKQIDPIKSGVQIRRFCSGIVETRLHGLERC